MLEDADRRERRGSRASFNSREDMLENAERRERRASRASRDSLEDMRAAVAADAERRERRASRGSLDSLYSREKDKLDAALAASAAGSPLPPVRTMGTLRDAAGTNDEGARPSTSSPIAQLRQGFKNSAIASCKQMRGQTRRQNSVDRLRRATFESDAALHGSRASDTPSPLPVALTSPTPAQRALAAPALPLAARAHDSHAAAPDSDAHRRKRASFDYGELVRERNASASSLETTGRAVVAHFKAAMHCEAGTILYVDDDGALHGGHGGALTAAGAKHAASMCSTQPKVFTFFIGGAHFSMPVDAGVAGACARELAVVRVDDAYADARFNRAFDERTGFRTHNILCAPMLARSDGRLLAVVEMLNKRERESGEPTPFTDADVAHIETCCAQLAPILDDRAREIEEKTGELKAAHLAGEAVTSVAVVG